MSGWPTEQNMVNGRRIYRASGDMICECGKEYRQHPIREVDWALAGESPCIVREICRGDYVKL